ncbi:hypothetical protein OSB04_016549 [Centaurea solstitialis]|uniref:RNase H type-1 domain-containing protein n=1 Tax=Centaurea solstitialis TaxID=347529 RepID=A0AA38T2T7_9ASTR|nr:hypothetical protein OSB04_016549 [Centaurea solstitialis]
MLQDHIEDESQDRNQLCDDLQLEEIVLDPEHLDRKEHSDCFAWSHEDMVGIDPNVISHKLNVDPSFKPIKQKHRKFAPKRNKVINDEVDNLLKTGKIREVKYPDWLANVVVVQKKNGKWRVCIDFTDLNKACPKDPFPLPHIDAMLDATTGHELLTFMDAYSGYNQILMHTNDQEKTAFMIDKGIYCYKVMQFGLKNVGSTYQRLVNMMFKEHLGRMMEVYIDDMLVKLVLGLSSDTTRNRSKPGTSESHHRIAITKECQRRRVAALNRFISRSSNKCHLFYNVLRKNQGFLWTNEHEKASQDLKQYMVSPPLLTKPVTGESLQLYLVVSNNATSAVLDQQQRPIYYVSKSFLDAETRYTSMEKLLLGLVTASCWSSIDGQYDRLYCRRGGVEYNQHSFFHLIQFTTPMEPLCETEVDCLRIVDAWEGSGRHCDLSLLNVILRKTGSTHHIIVVTNYPLKTVLRNPELTGRLAKWSIYLSGFDIEFKHKTAIKSQALADFVAEFSPGLEPTTCDEVHNVTIQDNKPWLLYVDGSSNVRGSGLGVVLKSSQGEIWCTPYDVTNNEAEYEAMIAGMDIAHKLGAKHLHVRSDSLLVVNQVNGDFQEKDSKMTTYIKIVKDRVARFDYFSIEQIPRDINTQADALANLGFAFNDPSMESIPILHLTTPTIEMKEEVHMNEEVYNWLFG